MDLLKQIALGMAAAAFRHPGQSHAQLADCGAPIPLSMGGDATSGRQGDFGPCGMVVGGSIGGAGFDCREHLCRLGSFGAAKGIEVLQRQEGANRVLPPGRYMIGHIAPTVSDIDTCKLHSRQQGNSAYLILGVILLQPPNMCVIGGTHVVMAALREIEKCQMPPIVAAHE
ncbi:hypothetical protein [Sulfitobacter dubius]|uniref:hypothetical protein n=1 Tax=Sulfitobacter dubius TaxID=218673 RepID=UPI0030DB9BAC